MKTKITFSYVEMQDFESPLEITMEVPERSIDEMCEYFQRFLAACGYVFDEGERIQAVKDESDYPGCGGDILTFNTDGVPLGYNFDTQEMEPLDFGRGASSVTNSGVRGGMAEDIIKFD